MTDPSSPATGATALVSTPDAPTALDLHGHDPADYQWVPVRRKKREDGWSNATQIAFIEALADTGSVTAAARAVDMSLTSCYRLRRAPGAGNFARAWDAAIQQASRKLVDVAFDRALNGVEEPLFDQDGRRVACRTRYNDRLLMFLLRAHQPERYRSAHRADRRADEELPPDPAPLGEALAALEPAVPPDPHRLMPPDAIEDALLCADILDGELPHWHREELPGLEEREPDDESVEEKQASIGPLGAAFEEALEKSKAENGAWNQRFRAAAAALVADDLYLEVPDGPF